ncbi:hypothetical protein GW17_00001586 [Ensete ventricosum]|nr:hypothetical protein GW17_00001586 [Ensete ventricosum]RZR94196.1 hypothetical protein BHM03_00022850 [Ensete ventricosum]
MRTACYRAVPSKIDLWQSIEREIDRRWSIEEEKGKKKRKRKKEEEGKKEYLVRVPSSPAGCLRTVAAHGSGRLFSCARRKIEATAPLTSTPVWVRDFDSSEELITEFCRECRIVRKGLAGDLKKAMKDGKPIIIEVW